MSSNDAGATFGPPDPATPAAHAAAFGSSNFGSTYFRPSIVGSSNTGYSNVEPVAVSSLVEQAHSAIADCAAELGFDELTLLTDRDLLSLTQQLEQTAHLADALLVQLSGAIDARSAPHLEDSLAKRAGCRNTTELLQRLSRRSVSSLGRRLKVARATRSEIGISGVPVLPDFPAVAAALAAGQLPLDSALQIIQSIKSLPSHIDPERVFVAERSIVAQAAGLPFEDDSNDEAGDIEDGATGDGDSEVEGEGGIPLPVDSDTVRLICDRWCSFLDQDGKEPSEEEAMAKRYFRLGREKNGLVPAHGLLTPDTAALIGNLFSAINSPLTSTNCDPTSGDGSSSDSAGDSAGCVHPGTDPAELQGVAAARASAPTSASAPSGVRFTEESVPGNERNGRNDERSYAQKVHDALRIVAETAARAAETPQLGGAPVTVLIQTTQEDLSKPSGTGTAWLHGHDGLPSPVSLSVARHGICAGATQRVLTGPRGEILGIDSPTRTFTAHQRRAIMARDGGCIIPGCTVPALWCEVHHVVEWANGGPTSTDNGSLLCWYHHRSIDSNDWHIRMVEGLPEVLAPPWIDPEQKWRTTRPPLRTNPARSVVAPRRDRARSGNVPGRARSEEAAGSC